MCNGEQKRDPGEERARLSAEGQPCVYCWGHCYSYDNVHLSGYDDDFALVTDVKLCCNVSSRKIINVSDNLPFSSLCIFSS